MKATERLVYTAAAICQNIANKVHMLNLSVSFQSLKKNDHAKFYDKYQLRKITVISWRIKLFQIILLILL